MSEFTTEFETERIVLKERRHEYDDVYTFVFTAPEPTLSKSFVPGSYAHVRVPGVPEGEKAVRELSFASAPEDNEVWFGVDTRSDSPYQRALLALSPGDVVELFKVRTKMTLPEREGVTAVLIAGGIGVTPFRSMLRHAVFAHLPITPVLIHVSHGTFLYESELQRLPYEQHRIGRTDAPAILAAAVSRYPDASYCVAGAAGFIKYAIDALHAAHVDDTRIMSDTFKGLAEE